MKYLDLMRQRQAEMTAKRSAIVEAMEQICSVADSERRGSLNPSESRQFDGLKAEVDALDVDLAAVNERVAELAEQKARVAEVASIPALNRGYARAARRSADHLPPHLVEQRDDAFRTIDAAVLNRQLPDYAAERVEVMLNEGRTDDRSMAARWAVAAGSPEYRTAFAKLLADPLRGHMMWTPAEADAYRRAEAINVEMRTAMSTTAANGGYMIPLTLDPAILLTNDGSINPLRRLATVKQTTSNAWQGVTSAGATAEWKTEGSQVADASPTLGSPSIPVFLGDAFVQYSYEVGQDAGGDFLGELTKVLTDAADQLQATANTTGGGTTAPQGIVTGLAGTSSEINTTGSESLDDSDPYALQNALPARFSQNAVFMSHIATANTYRQMETTAGALMFPELRQNPPQLIGKPWVENSNMDSSINAAATANNYMLVYGDIRAGYYIVDRVGSTLELIPNLMGANDRPTGQRGALLWFRTGAEVVIPGALRLLDVPTTA